MPTPTCTPTEHLGRVFVIIHTTSIMLNPNTTDTLRWHIWVLWSIYTTNNHHFWKEMFKIQIKRKRITIIFKATWHTPMIHLDAIVNLGDNWAVKLKQRQKHNQELVQATVAHSNDTCGCHCKPCCKYMLIWDWPVVKRQLLHTPTVHLDATVALTSKLRTCYFGTDC